MSDRAAVLLAVLAAATALASPPVPLAAGLLVIALAAVVRHPAVVAVGLVLLVGARAEASLGALDAPLPPRVDGLAELASDPEPQRFGTRFVVRVDGRRYLADVPNDRAAEVRGMLTGEWVHLRGRPRPFASAPQGWLRSQHLAGRLTVDHVVDAGRSPPWYRVANAAHRTLSAGAAPFVERRPLYLGLVIGDERGQAELTRFRFEAAGLTHLLAVSGSNVAFVLAVFAPVMQRLGRHGRLAMGGSVLFVFVLVTRAEPSVLRASVMAAVALGAVTAGRVAPGIRILAVTVTLLLLADPLLVHSIGFQLSVAATAGLLLLSRPIMDRLPGPERITGPLAVTLAAQLATAPLLFLLNGGLPSVATLANLLAGPAAGLVMILGVTAGMAAGLVGDTTASVIQSPAVVLVRWIDLVAELTARLPAPVLGPGRLALLLVSVLAAVVRRWRRRDAGSRCLGEVGLLGVAAVAVVLALWPPSPTPGRHGLVAGAELGVGECGGRVLLVDGAQNRRQLLRALWLAGVHRLDLVVVGERRSDAAVAALVGEQLRVGRFVTLGERAPPGMEPLAHRRLVVGGVVVGPSGTGPGPSEPTHGSDASPAAEGPMTLIGASGGRCSLAP